jgi:hypothetical protein
LLFGGVADAADDAEEVEAHEGFLGVEAEDRAGEEVGVGEARGYRRAQAEELLQGLEEVLEGVWFAFVEALYDGLAEACVGEEVLFYLGRLFLQPDENGV